MKTFMGGEMGARPSTVSVLGVRWVLLVVCVGGQVCARVYAYCWG